MTILPATLHAEIDKVFDDFVRSGKLLDTATRRKLAHLVVLHLYDLKYDAPARLRAMHFDRNYPQWWPVLNRFFSETALRGLTAQNPHLSLSVARHSLLWCDALFQTLSEERKDDDELQELRRWQKESAHSATSWDQLLDDLIQRYPDYAADWDFFRRRMSGNPGPTRLLLRSKVLTLWESLLQTQQIRSEAELIERAFAEFLSELQRKYQLLLSLGEVLAPYYRYLGHLWTQNLPHWDRIPWDRIVQYLDRMREDPGLLRLAELLGRYRNVREIIRPDQAPLPKNQSRWRPSPYGKSEITGIRQGRDIHALLPAEITLLSQPETELIFAKKYAEGKLLSFAHRGEEPTPEPQPKPQHLTTFRPEAHGPMVVCLDTSGSMFGGLEETAKALAFALTEVAQRHNRACYLILFSEGVKTYCFSEEAPELEKLVEFLTLSFQGGTYIEPALRAAIQKIREQEFRQADVLVVSDFLLPRVDPALLREAQRLRADQGVRFHSLLLTRRPNPRLKPLAIFDFHWQYDLTDPNIIRQTLEALEEVAQNDRGATRS